MGFRNHISIKDNKGNTIYSRQMFGNHETIPSLNNWLVGNFNKWYDPTDEAYYIGVNSNDDDHEIQEIPLSNKQFKEYIEICYQASLMDIDAKKGSFVINKDDSLENNAKNLINTLANNRHFEVLSLINDLFNLNCLHVYPTICELKNQYTACISGY